MKFLRKKNKYKDIDPDEIFLDSSNLANLNQYQMEGRLEKPISIRAIFALISFFFIFVLVFLGKSFNLQVVNGEEYVVRSENNRLNKKVLFAERGVISDRTGEELAWNEPPRDGEDFSRRQYSDLDGVHGVLGYVSYPKKDKFGFYFRQDLSGQAGLEQQYDDLLRGENGYKLEETDALEKSQGQSSIIQLKNGKNLTLSIDASLSNKLYQLMQQASNEIGYQSGAAIILDTHTGEILAMPSFPEYNSNLLSDGSDKEKIDQLLNSTQKPFLNRVVAGLYSPGSIVKPFVALAALNENVITPEKQILSTGSISIPNPYFPQLKTVFNDWKAHGWVNMREAIAASSDVYFYEVGGGFQTQPGLGIERLKKYETAFGIGQKTGINLPGEVEGTIPSPEWKLKKFPGDPWRVGDTYNTAIGQYGFQVTPIQMARAVAFIANDGKLITPTLISRNDLSATSTEATSTILIKQKDFDVVKEGMRLVVTSPERGTARQLDIPELDIAAKTGTAQVGVNNSHVNSWAVGFYPYKNPKYVFVMVMERGPLGNSRNSASIMSDFFKWLVKEKPEYAA